MFLPYTTSMNEEFIEHLRDLTFKDLWKETLLLEKSEASEERNIRIKLLRTKAEFFQLINKLKRMQVETPEFMRQFDLVGFFESDNHRENDKRIILLKSRLTKLTNSRQDCRIQTQTENGQ